MKRRMFTVALAVVVSVIVAFAAMGWWSAHRATPATGITGATLKACSNAPNCVCSEAQFANDAAHFTAPLAALDSDSDSATHWEAVGAEVAAMGGTIVELRADYLHATFTSRLFRFVDDLELRRDRAEIHVRSASRVGYSDFGVNAKRVEALRGRLSGGEL
jgi:uncharacterized protein (DUF1499 family)